MKNKVKMLTCEDITGEKYEVPTSQLTFRRSVYGVIIKDKKILFSKQ